MTAGDHGPSPAGLRDVYRSFSELRAHHREGEDFDRTVLPHPTSQVVILAPHGGRLENHTDTIAERIAGEDFSLYCFRSRLGFGGTNLHITSHRFDDPDCLSLVARHHWAVAVHGCSSHGERVFLGGRDRPLVDDLARSLQHAGIEAEASGHAYPGQHPDNICNRTARQAGVQVEMTMPFRLSGAVPAFVAALRSVLLSRQAASLRAVALALATAGLAAQTVEAGAATPVDLGPHAVPTRLVEVGGRGLNLRCTGTGSPTVVFESVLGSPGWEWAEVQAGVAQRTRACVHDRAGLGFSDPSPRPGTAAHAADDLSTLLRTAGERPPYVLVGASYGAMVVRLLAAARPSDVSALVLVDGHHEDEFDRINRLSSGRYGSMMAGLEQSYRDCAAAAERGMPPDSAEWAACAGEPPPFADRRLAAAHVVQARSPAYWRSALSEMEHLHTTSSDQMRAARDRLGPVPVLALVRSRSPFDTPGKRPSALSIAVEKDNVAMQAETAALSPAGRTRVVPNAGHAIHLDQPGAVIDAVLEFVP